MGSDIHAYAEGLDNSKHSFIEEIDFDGRDYSIFGFLADFRNYSDVKPIGATKGFPKDSSQYLATLYNEGWTVNPHHVSVHKLIYYDYEQIIEDKRHNGETLEVGVKMSLRDFLGPCYFRVLSRLKAINVDRLVFWFT